MSEHFEGVVRHVMSDDDSELAKVKAERDYALHCLEREIAIAQSEQARSAALMDGLERIWDIVHTPTSGTAHRSARAHFQADFDSIRKIISGCRTSVGTAGDTP